MNAEVRQGYYSLRAVTTSMTGTLYLERRRGANEISTSKTEILLHHPTRTRRVIFFKKVNCSLHTIFLQKKNSYTNTMAGKKTTHHCPGLKMGNLPGNCRQGTTPNGEPICPTHQTICKQTRPTGKVCGVKRLLRERCRICKV